MSIFFIIVEILALALPIYLLLYRRELSIIYIPLIIFAKVIITPSSPAFLHYSVITILILYSVYQNSSFFSKNIYSLCLILIYLILVTNVSNFDSIRPNFFACLWFFTSLPLISTIYRKHSRDKIVKELSTVAFLILCLFVLNVIMSTMTGYSPYEMYGITSGVLYGNLYATDFNILAIATFLVLAFAVRQRNVIYFITSLTSLAFILLSLRRSVMLLSIIGIIIVILIFSTKNNIRNVIVFGAMSLVVSFVVIPNTNFLLTFIERYEQRNLADRELEEETRFLEYELIYDDIFLYEDYSPLFGYELLNSAGNYGKGILDDRTLHSDITNMIHSTGIVGLSLYLLMVVACFIQAFRSSKTREDYLIVTFCACVFLVYTITGRYTSSESMIILFLTLMLPITNRENQLNKIEEKKAELVRF
ncbi:O-antigen ligase family protein [Pontibacter virosus]|uniref:O-antigen ligase-like membrane protein n=1 Tax=Pontibacter virosus TaxID=1765052 RepID=A0A2U1AJS0_9BACT|nr:O-antigen ligase family protein [Pontibacter virosus]PVY36666.1 O-antigen ligase-like membrane protein [Pontibacter virosus]